MWLLQRTVPWDNILPPALPRALLVPSVRTRPMFTRRFVTSVLTARWRSQKVLIHKKHAMVSMFNYQIYQGLLNLTAKTKSNVIKAKFVIFVKRSNIMIWSVDKIHSNVAHIYNKDNHLNIKSYVQIGISSWIQRSHLSTQVLNPRQM